jgi:methyl-accepting chemotaxis protein
MMRFFRSVQRKLLASFFGVALVTILALGITAYQVSKSALVRSIGQSYADIAAAAMDKIDRNLFERYGDVQAFADNQAAVRFLQGVGSRAEFQAFADRMLTTYGIYDQMIICNAQGKVTLATTLTNTGSLLNTESLLGLNMSGKAWFQACTSGKITQGHSYISDPLYDSTLQGIFREIPYVMHFASPIRDSSGAVIGVWLNYASFDRIVREIIMETIRTVREQGFSSFSVTLLDKNGTTIDDEERSLIGNFNMRGKFAAVDKALAGSKKGYDRATSARTGRDRLISYARSQGALGFAGTGWVYLAYGDASEALSLVATIRNSFILVGGIVLIVVVVLAGVIARGIVRPIKRLNAAAHAAASGDYSTELRITTGDEIEELSNSFAVMLTSVKGALQQAHDEKASVERKVEEAVHQTRAEKEYLQECVDKILVKMEDFANGDFTATIHSQREDEIARLYAGFNLAVKIMRDIVLRIRASAQENVTVASEITHLSTELKQQIERQSERMDEIATATEEMNTTIAENARNAAITARAAERNGAVATEGGSVVSLTAEKMRRIGEVIGVSARTVESLGNASSQISEILSVINDIADQTNLLALNAAIEAARAGEQGRGFAVVADEVRKLAERTTAATREISAMVTGIQSETHSAVSQIEIGNQAVQEGVQFAERASAALHDIVKSSAEVQQMVSEIATACTEQSSASESIAQHVGEISSLAKHSAQQIQQASNAVDELHELSRQIEIQISQFIMDESQKRARMQRNEAALSNAANTKSNAAKAQDGDSPSWQPNLIAASLIAERPPM